MKKSNKHIAELIKKNILEIDKNAEIILYGSRARGDDNEKSDWDILVLTDYPVDYKIESRFIENIYKLELETEEVFSIFVYSKEEWNTKQKISPLYDNVSNEGILL